MRTMQRSSRPWPGWRRTCCSPAAAAAGSSRSRPTGLIAAMFTHRDARSSDPHLHTHVAVSNKVQDSTGRWLAVDGRVLYKANVTCSELVQHAARGRAGRPARGQVQRSTAARQSQRGKRPVREIEGIDERLATYLVASPGRDRGPTPGARGRVPGRARPPTHRRRISGAGEAGVVGDPAGQARARARRQSSGRSGGPRRSRSSAPRPRSTGWSTRVSATAPRART